ncbi:MAG: PilZ domain-containing protein [Acidobacteriota bacterium]|nr:PilZ domain-containing protein [Acidobacteriota bacterium]MDQ3753554.1 PilZ domain-containing protein [Acidobacteriota bacterium]
MNDEISQSAEGVPSQRPRSPRVPVNFPVELEGQTPAGEPFQTRAEAVRVSRGGATLITEASVAMGATVRLTPPFGHALEAEVNGIWTDETDGQQRVGVKLLDPNGWFAE